MTAIVAFGLLILTMLWRDRDSLDDIDIARPPSVYDVDSPVTVTWFGVTTLLFDDGENQFGGHDLLSEARLLDNTLTLVLHEPAKELDNASEIVLTFEATESNLASMEAGAFRVLGDAMTGGNA